MPRAPLRSLSPVFGGHSGAREGHERTEWWLRLEEGGNGRRSFMGERRLALGAGAHRRSVVRAVTKAEGTARAKWVARPRGRGWELSASRVPAARSRSAVASVREVTEVPPNERLKQTRLGWSRGEAWSAAYSRGCTVIVSGGGRVLASQLKRSVLRTLTLSHERSGW